MPPENTPLSRELCVACWQPAFSCFCADVRRFDPRLRFAILNHPIEARRRIATGRMSHLCLEGSQLLIGHDYTHDERVNRLLADPALHCVLLYPGPRSLNLTGRSAGELAAQFPAEKQIVVFVIDGTWATARQTANQSKNLRELPRIAFTPPGPSNFRVRKQPGVDCYSTIEAVHHVIELLGPLRGFDPATREHDNLLYAFDRMVERELLRAKRGHIRERKFIPARDGGPRP